MLDNLRDDSSSRPFFEDEAQFQQADVSLAPPPRRTNGRFLGMTPMQRFVIAVMLMLTVCLVGTLCLFATQKIAVFFY